MKFIVELRNSFVRVTDEEQMSKLLFHWSIPADSLVMESLAYSVADQMRALLLKAMLGELKEGGGK